MFCLSSNSQTQLQKLDYAVNSCQKKFFVATYLLDFSGSLCGLNIQKIEEGWQTHTVVSLNNDRLLLLGGQAPPPPLSPVAILPLNQLVTSSKLIPGRMFFFQ